MGLLIEATLIVFREGLEATLVLAALATFLIGSAVPQRLKALYLGAAIGGLASIVAGFMLQAALSFFNEPVVRAVLVIGAALLMGYLSGWMWVRRDVSVWHHLVRRGANFAVDARTGLAVFALAFLVVFREGVEAVVFLKAISGGTADWRAALVEGPILGVALLGLVFAGLRLFSKHVSMRQIFSLTSGCFFVLALKYLGEGLGLLQQAGLVSRTSVPHGGFMTALGLNPTWEAVVAQIMIIALGVAGAFALLGRNSEVQP